MPSLLLVENNNKLMEFCVLSQWIQIATAVAFFWTFYYTTTEMVHVAATHIVSGQGDHRVICGLCNHVPNFTAKT